MKRAFCIGTLWLALLLPSWGAGLIVVEDGAGVDPPGRHPPRHPIPPWPRPPRPWSPLETVFTHVTTKIDDQHAQTLVKQAFYNPNERRMEGTFLFPVPKGAQLEGFTLEIDGRPVEAELLEAEKARSIYESIVRKQRDPALLEYLGQDLFSVRVFPIDPHAKREVTLSYSEILKADAGVVTYRFPLGTEKYSARPLKQLSLTLTVESPHPLKSVYSPTHEIEVKRHGDHRVTAGFEGVDVNPEGDFELLFSREEGEVGLTLLTHRTGEEDGYFLLLATPAVALDRQRVLPKDVVLVLDTSGSMAGAKLAQAKKALTFCVENLNEEDRFEILRFSTEVEPLFGGLRPVGEREREQARSFVTELKPLGGTAIDEALGQALAVGGAAPDRPQVVIFLTDGRPTVGPTSENQIVDRVQRDKESLTRIFCFGIGTDVNTHLLDRITEATRASSQYVLPEEDLEVKVSRFFTKIKEPVLAETELHFPGDLRVGKLHPSRLPDLFKGEQLVVAGRYAGSGHACIRLRGTLQGRPTEYVWEGSFPQRGEAHDFIPRLWATRRVGFLLDEIRLRGEDRELREEVTALARRYGIVTPYTAYLILEDEAQRGLTERQKLLPEAFHRSESRRQFAIDYEQLAEDRSGDAAVGGARFLSTLKGAESAPAAIQSGNRDALRARAGQPTSERPGQRQSDQALAQVIRAIGDRTFFLREGRWVDSQVGEGNRAPRTIALGSPEYFRLLQDHPEAAAWLALGPQVTFLLNGDVYEIVE